MSDHGVRHGAESGGSETEMTHQEVQDELLSLVDQGLLHMGVNEEGECIFWPTDEGIDALEMTEIPVAPAS